MSITGECKTIVLTTLKTFGASGPTQQQLGMMRMQH